MKAPPRRGVYFSVLSFSMTYSLCASIMPYPLIWHKRENSHASVVQRDTAPDFTDRILYKLGNYGILKVFSLPGDYLE